MSSFLFANIVKKFENAKDTIVFQQSIFPFSVYFVKQ